MKYWIIFFLCCIILGCTKKRNDKKKRAYEQFHTLLLNQRNLRFEIGNIPGVTSFGKTEVEVIERKNKDKSTSSYSYPICKVFKNKDKLGIYFELFPRSFGKKNVFIEVENDDFETTILPLHACPVTSNPRTRVYQNKLELNKTNYEVNDTILGRYSFKSIQIQCRRYCEDIEDYNESDIASDLEINGIFQAIVKDDRFGVHVKNY